MALYYYTVEVKSRFEFYDHATQIEFQKSYKKFLGRMPNGIILLDKRSNSPVFYNRIISKIIANKTGVSSTNSPSFDGSETHLDEIKNVPSQSLHTNRPC